MRSAESCPFAAPVVQSRLFCIQSRRSFPATETPDPRRASEGFQKGSLKGSLKGFRRVLEGVLEGSSADPF